MIFKVKRPAQRLQYVYPTTDEGLESLFTNALERIRAILPYVQNNKQLVEATSFIVKMLLSHENKYSSFPNNVEVVSLIQNRVQEFSSKN